MNNAENTQPKSQRTVSVVPYQTSWAADFAKERTALIATLGEVVQAAQHIGSTAVVGLAAKPIIDILLTVTDLQALDAQSATLATLGYVAKGENGIIGRRYFQKGGQVRTHHLHAFVQGAPQITAHLSFRDYLRENPDVVAQYAQLKLALIRQFAHDTVRYQAGKDEFITQLFQKISDEQERSNSSSP